MLILRFPPGTLTIPAGTLSFRSSGISWSELLGRKGGWSRSAGVRAAAWRSSYPALVTFHSKKPSGTVMFAMGVVPRRRHSDSGAAYFLKNTSAPGGLVSNDKIWDI